MSKEILVSIDEYENRVAVMEDKKLCEIYISREDRKIGSIYKGKVTNVLPGMQAAFINIGLEKNAFLCVEDILTKDRIDDEDDDFKKALLSIKDIIKVNQDMLVQVIKESIGGKGPRVTAQITLPGRYFVYLPMVQYLGVSRKISDEAERERLKEIARKIRKHKEGLILRTAAEYKEQKELEDDYESLVKLWKKIFYSSKKMKSPILVHQELTLVYKVVRDIFTKEYDKMIIDSSAEYEKILELLDIFAPDLKNRVHLYQEKLPLFQAYEVEKDIEKALKKKVWLDSGGYLIIERTEALTVIDVNSGKYVGKDSLAQTILKINIESAKEIAHQLRLRDLGGIIIIDFIDMDNNEDKKKVLDLLEQELKKDRVKVFLVGITELGLVQLTRKRMRKDLSSYLSIDCPQCKGEGKIFSIESIKIRFEREIKKIAVENKIDSILA